MSRVKKILLPVLVVAAGAAVALLLAVSRPEVETVEPETPPPLVRIIEVAPRTVRLDVASQGTVVPRSTTTLVAQVAGRVEGIAPGFAVGSLVERGQSLVRLDARDYRLSVSQAEAQVAQARLRLAREEAEARVAREEWQELGDGGTGDGRAPSPLVLREPQLAEARAAVAAAEATVEQARLAVGRTTVAAPFRGRVTEKLVDLGQAVSPGTPLGRLYAVDYVEVSLPVPVDELRLIDVPLTGETVRGPEVLLSAELSGARRTWRGRVVRTGGAIDPATRMLSVVVRVDDPYGAAARQAGAPLPVGLFVEAAIAGAEADGVLVVPRSALRQTAGGSPLERRATVLVAEPSADSNAPSRLALREVEILRLTRDEAVIAAGLEPGERVIVSPMETPVAGMALRTVVDPPAAAAGARTTGTGAADTTFPEITPAAREVAPEADR